jgi:chitinase
MLTALTAVTRPVGGGASANKRAIGYYESWAPERPCDQVEPEDLNVDGFTHLNFAFAYFDPDTYEIQAMDTQSGSLFARFTGLKANNPSLQTWISIGGWSFTDPGSTQTAFSDMASSSSSRQKFIKNLMTFMDTYGFDGVDLDWEYPVASDRGGVTADKQNYVKLLIDLKDAFGTKYGLSITLPTSYWYLQHFLLTDMEPYVDWFNLMAYDLHGTWDATDKYVGPYIAPHTNLTEIDASLDLLWRAGVDPSKGKSLTLLHTSDQIQASPAKMSSQSLQNAV